jgi:hypothetical protein
MGYKGLSSINSPDWAHQNRNALRVKIKKYGEFANQRIQLSTFSYTHGQAEVYNWDCQTLRNPQNISREEHEYRSKFGLRHLVDSFSPQFV